MKRTDFRKATIGEHNFYIYPFSALKAANLSGELVKLIAPALGSIGASVDTKNVDKLLDSDVRTLAPALSGAFGSLSGDTLETLLRKLLIVNENVAFDNADGKTVRLTEEDLDTLFCGDVQDMYVLAFEVIRTNYGGFFAKLGSRFGGASEPSTETATV